MRHLLSSNHRQHVQDKQDGYALVSLAHHSFVRFTSSPFCKDHYKFYNTIRIFWRSGFFDRQDFSTARIFRPSTASSVAPSHCISYYHKTPPNDHVKNRFVYTFIFCNSRRFMTPSLNIHICHLANTTFSQFHAIVPPAFPRISYYTSKYMPTKWRRKK